MRLLADTTPLRVSPAFRRLWVGQALATTGMQMAVTALGLQVYDLTGSTFAVGLVGAFALGPLVLLGLYGGALVDEYDRRTVALGASLLLWAVALATLAQALLDVASVAVLYLLTAIGSAGFAVVGPARSAAVPRLVARELLPAANALQSVALTLGLTAGPVLGGMAVEAGGFALAYGVDAVLYLAALWAVWRLPPLPPEREPDRPGQPVAVRLRGWRSVAEGLTFLGTRPNLRMTFFLDLSAMVLALPRVLFPAVALVSLGGGAQTVGLLTAAIAAGSVLAGVLSGPLGQVRRQGLAVVAAIGCWSLSVIGFGVVVLFAAELGDAALPLALACLAAGGASDAVSAVFRTTMLQAAVPDALRGRLQGVFIVVVAGGPRLGDVALGGAAEGIGEGWAALAGGVACLLVVLVLVRAQPRFLAYDARHPAP